MGMEHNDGPRRRRVGDEDGRVQQTVRLSGEARAMADRLQGPDVLMQDGCSLGDVIEIALGNLAKTQLRGVSLPEVDEDEPGDDRVAADDDVGGGDED